ncbi:MAG: hypothetical protein SH850_21265 [Planctomycetaceae bacterium]|nr:hypothetical protein [Planctomycetaceae bacterium]
MATATLTPTNEVETDNGGGIADLNTLRASMAVEREAATAAYHAAIIATAKGSTPADLRAILSAAGRSVDEFQASVEVLIRRLAAARQQADAEALPGRIDAALKSAGTTQETLDRATEEWEQQERDLREAASAARATYEQLRHARHALLRQSDDVLFATCHPNLSERLTELDARRQLIASERNIEQQRQPAHVKDVKQRDQRLIEIDAELSAIESERKQIEADRMDPVRGLMLGVAETAPEVKAGTVGSWLRDVFGVKTVVQSNGAISHE